MTLSLLAIAAGIVAAWLAPSGALVLVDLDRTITPLGPGLEAVVRAAIGIVTAALVAGVSWVISGTPLTDLRRVAAAWWQRPDSPTHAAVLVGLAVIGAWVRWPALFLPVSYDEAISVVWFSSRSWLDVISDHTIPNNHIFHNLLVNLVTTVFGLSTATARVPAFVAGMLCVPLTYWLTSRLWRSDAALLAAGVAAAAPMVVEYSTQARGYSLLWVFFMAAFVLATYLRERDDTRLWAAQAVITALGLWTMPTMLYGSAMIGLWLIASVPVSRRREVIVRTVVWGLIACALAGAFYLPALLRTGVHQTPAALSNALAYPRIPVQWTAGLPWPFVLLLGAGLVTAVVRADDRRAVLTLLASAAAAHAGLLVIRKVPPNRVLFYLFFVVAGIACHGVATLLRARTPPRWRRGAVLALSLAVPLIWAFIRADVVRPVIDASGLAWVQGMEPGAEGVRCCSDGYYIDAEPLVADLLPRLRPGEAIVAPDFVGAVETMRFYLLARGRSPTLVHPYREELGPAQLTPYGDLVVVVKRADHRPPGLDERPTPLLPQLEDAVLHRVYADPERIATYRISGTYTLRRREPRRPEDVPATIPFNMFWYW